MMHIRLLWKLVLGYTSIIDCTKYVFIEQTKVLTFNKYQYNHCLRKSEIYRV